MEYQKNIGILYHTRNREFMMAVKCAASEIGRESGITLNVNVCNSFDYLERLPDIPHYDLVVVHMEIHDFNDYAFNEAEKIKKKYSGPIVAESFRHPYGEEDTLRHFSGYYPPICKKENFVDMLKTVGYLPNPTSPNRQSTRITLKKSVIH